MTSKQIIELIEKLTELSIINKKINVSRYPEMEAEITDDFIELLEVFPKDEWEQINENFKPYLEAHEVYPIIGTVGDNVVCIGSSSNIYYFDFDFGLFKLNDCLEEFIVWLS